MSTAQASHVTFGFEFQVYAGIYLMLRHIKEFSQIKIEGEDEDIEITLADASKLFIQAKSVVDQYNKPNSYFKPSFSKGLASLSKNKLNSFDKIIYISNIESRPFGLESNQFEFDYFLSYRDLKPQNQQAIKAIINNSKQITNAIDVNKLIIAGFPFHGSDSEQREKAVLEKLKDLLAPISDQLFHESRQILSYWFDCFFDNSTRKSNNYSLTKDKIIWDLIAFCLNPTGKEEDLLCNLGEDELAVYDAANAYKDIIYRKTNNFPDYNKILLLKSDYDTHLGRQTRIEEFINENRNKITLALFSKETPDGINEDLLDICALLIATKILLKQNTIKKIMAETTQ